MPDDDTTSVPGYIIPIIRGQERMEAAFRNLAESLTHITKAHANIEARVELVEHRLDRPEPALHFTPEEVRQIRTEREELKRVADERRAVELKYQKDIRILRWSVGIPASLTLALFVFSLALKFFGVM